MMRIHRPINADSMIGYHAGNHVKEGYYANKESISHWRGGVAKLLGLHGEKVTNEDLADLVKHNRIPRTKDQLKVRNLDKMRPGWDITFSSVKSASVIYALTGDDNILSAHQFACEMAAQAIQRDAQTQANTEQGRFYETTSSTIYALYDHFLSRPCEVKSNGKTLYVSDPALHSHLVLPNLTFSKKHNQLQALELGNIHKQATYYQEIYHSYFAYKIREAGYQIRRTADRYEIEGVSRDIIRNKFSNRTKIIEQAAKDKNITDPRAKGELGAKTRLGKNKGVKEDQLPKIWKDRLSNDEYDLITNLKGKQFASSKPLNAKEAVQRAIDHWEERHSSYMEKRLIATALTYGYGTLLPEDIEHELIRSDIVRKEKDTITYMTTKSMIRSEIELHDLAINGKSQFPPIYPNYKIKNKIFNPQQQKAISDILGFTGFVSLYQGAAGSGKTTSVEEISKALKEVKKPFYSLAPSSSAVDVLRETGMEADTIAAFLHNPKLAEKVRGGVLWVDEASLSGVRTTTELLKKAKSVNARVVLSGDIFQNHSVEYGDAFRMLQDAKLETARVSEIVRQENQDYKLTVQLLSKQQTLDGYQVLNKMGAIKEIEDPDQRLNKIADTYIASNERQRSALIVSATNAENDLINSVVRQKLRAKGRLRGKEHELQTLQNINLTDSQKKDIAVYEGQQVIRFTKNQRSNFKAGEEYEVLPSKKPGDLKIKHTKTGKVSKLPYETPEHYQVYQKTKTPLAIGDILRVTTNTVTNQNTKIFNGTTHAVKSITKTGIHLSNGKTLPRDFAHFRHGYSMSSHAAQGKTVQDCIVSVSSLSSAGMTSEGFYVAVSRGKQNISVFTSNKDELKQSIVRSGQRMTAREIADPPQQDLLQRQQRNHHRSLNEKIRELGRSKEKPRRAKQTISKSQGHERER